MRGERLLNGRIMFGRSLKAVTMSSLRRVCEARHPRPRTSIWVSFWNRLSVAVEHSLSQRVDSRLGVQCLNRTLLHPMFRHVLATAPFLSNSEGLVPVTSGIDSLYYPCDHLRLHQHIPTKPRHTFLEGTGLFVHSNCGSKAHIK